MAMKSIAFLGLGAMGSRMAARLLAAGHALTVWNRSAAATEPLAMLGANIAASPRGAAAGADIVIAMLRDDEASSSVWLDPEEGAVAGLRKGALAIESSTLSLAHIETLASRIATVGGRFLDAPVAGSRPQAEAGQLIFIVGGSAIDLDQTRDALLAMGGAVHHAGPIGAGAALKLAVNAMFGIQVAAIGEILGMLGKAGVDPQKALEILGATPVLSPAAKGAAAGMLAGNFAPMFPIELVAKDFSYVEAAGQGAMPLTRSTAGVLASAIAAGFAKDNLTGLVRLYR